MCVSAQVLESMAADLATVLATATETAEWTTLVHELFKSLGTLAPTRVSAAGLPFLEMRDLDVVEATLEWLDFSLAEYPAAHADPQLADALYRVVERFVGVCAEKHRQAPTVVARAMKCLLSLGVAPRPLLSRVRSAASLPLVLSEILLTAPPLAPRASVMVALDALAVFKQEGYRQSWGAAYLILHQGLIASTVPADLDPVVKAAMKIAKADGAPDSAER